MRPTYTLGTANSMLFSKMLIIITLFCSTFSMSAQGINSISISPSAPTTATAVTANIDYYLSNGCWSFVGSSYSWSGSTVNVYLNFNYSGSPNCPYIFITANHAVGLGTLAAGTYTVKVWDLDQGNGLLGTKVFTVSNAGCPPPALSQIFTSSVSTNSAVLNGPWGYSLTDYQYRLLGSATWVNVNSTSTNYTTITSLSPNTSYEFRIAVRCSNGIWSAWSSAKTFVTQSNSCPTPLSSLFTASNINTNSITLVAPSGYSGLDLQFRQLGNSSWIDVSSTSSNTITVSGLAAGTTYEFRFSVRCSNGIWCNWTGIRTFATASGNTCTNPPLNQVYAANITSNSAIIYGPTGYLGLDIQYRAAGSLSWIDVSSTSGISIFLGNLSPNTHYEYRFSVRCASGWSNWSGTQSFITSIPSISNGDDPCSAFNVSSSNSCIYQTYSTSGASVTTNPPITGVLCDYGGTNDIWIRIVMPSTGKITVNTLAGTVNDIVVAAYSGTNCSNLTYFGCIDDDSQGNLMPNFTVTSSSPYVWLRIWGYSSNGSFSLCVQTNYNLTDGNADITEYDVQERTSYSTKKDGQNDLIINVSPNPAVNEINLNISGLKGEKATLILFDQQGKQQNSIIEATIENGKINNYPIDLSNLSSGLYFLRVISEDKQIVHKFMKLK
jgi:chitodextrinase